MTLARVKIMNDHIIASWQAARCTAARYVVCIDTISGSSLRPAVIALFRSLTRRYSIQSSWLRSSALTLLHLFSLSLSPSFSLLFSLRPPPRCGFIHSRMLAFRSSFLSASVSCSFRSLLPFFLSPVSALLSLSLSPFHRCLLFIHSSARFLAALFPPSSVFFFNSSRHDRSLHGDKWGTCFVIYI